MNDMTQFNDNDRATIKLIATETAQAHQASCPINALLNTKLDAIGERLSAIEETLKETNTKLWIGNGKEALSTRVDRIEQSRDSHSKWIAILATAILGIILTAGWDIIKEKLQAKPASPAASNTQKVTP